MRQLKTARPDPPALGNPGRPALALLAAALLAAGCLAGGGRRDKSAVSGLWVEPEELRYLDSELVSRLEDAGIGEFFIPLADLDLAGGDGPLVRRPIPQLESTLKLDVVVGGRLALAGAEPQEAAERVGEAVQQLLFDVEASGIVPVGVHFDLREIDSVADAAAFFNKLRGVLDRSFYLSTSLRRAWIDDQEIASLAKAADFVVPFLYGRRIWERDSDDAWDFSVVRQRLEQLEGYKASYMLGITGIGNVTHSDRNGKVKAFTSKQALSPFLWNRSLELRRGFSLQATHRRVYTLVAESPTRAGGWAIEPKDEIRLVRPMTSDLDELLEMLAQSELPHLVGELYYRLPAPEERLSLTAENILNALDPKPVAPDLRFEVQISRRTRRGARFRFLIENRNGEPTEFSLLDNNFLQITAEPDAFGAVDLGDFYRYDLLRMQDDGTYDRMFRGANVVRLHLPILEGQQRVSSGDVEIHRRSPVLRLDARFMMPDGHTVEFGPFTWSDGVLHGQEEDEPAAAEAEPGEGEG